MRVTITTADESEAARLMAAKDMAHVLWEFDQELRNALKHTIPPEAGETAESALEWARTRLHDYLRDNNLDLDRLG